MNIAMLSQWHVHAPGYAKEAAADPRVRITAIWDELPERGAAWANELGATFIPDLDALFSDPSLDAVINCAPTRLHGDLLTRAARAGKHIFTEKVLTLTRGGLHGPPGCPSEWHSLCHLLSSQDQPRPSDRQTADGCRCVGKADLRADAECSFRVHLRLASRAFL